MCKSQVIWGTGEQNMYQGNKICKIKDTGEQWHEFSRTYAGNSENESLIFEIRDKIDLF